MVSWPVGIYQTTKGSFVASTNDAFKQQRLTLIKQFMASKIFRAIHTSNTSNNSYLQVLLPHLIHQPCSQKNNTSLVPSLVLI